MKPTEPDIKMNNEPRQEKETKVDITHFPNIFIRLVSMQAMIKEIDNDVWGADDALDRTAEYLKEVVADIELILDYIKQVKAGRWDND